MSPDQAREYAMQQWQQMSHDDQMAYENQAQLAGDPIAQKQAAEAAARARGPTSATMYNSDGTVSQVQYH
jgi:hypothetical protein